MPTTTHHHRNATNRPSRCCTRSRTLPIGSLLLVGDEPRAARAVHAGRPPAQADRARLASYRRAASPMCERSCASTSPASAHAFELALAMAWHAIRAPRVERAYRDSLRGDAQLWRARAHGSVSHPPRAPSVLPMGATRSRSIVPCHRVIGANGTLTGYGGGLERKRILLELEGGQAQHVAVGMRLWACGCGDALPRARLVTKGPARANGWTMDFGEDDEQALLMRCKLERAGVWRLLSALRATGAGLLHARHRSGGARRGPRRLRRSRARSSRSSAMTRRGGVPTTGCSGSRATCSARAIAVAGWRRVPASGSACRR